VFLESPRRGFLDERPWMMLDKMTLDKRPSHFEETSKGFEVYEK